LNISEVKDEIFNVGKVKFVRICSTL